MSSTPSPAPSGNGTALEAIDALPEAIRLELKHGGDWNPGAIRFKLQRQSEAEVLEFLRVAREQREAAAYRELGHTIHPKTGDPL